MTKEYLPVVVPHIPAEMVFDGHNLRPNIAHYARVGCVRVIAGGLKCHLVIDIKRPYQRPPKQLNHPFVEAAQ